MTTGETPPPQATVVICTFDRPLLLERAVLSCRRDASPRGVAFEIVVVDNSDTNYARPILERLKEAGVSARWIEAHPPNISVARNAGLRAARAPWLAFMDDDVEVEVGWLDHLMKTAKQCEADVVLGPVRPRFDQEAPTWDPSASRFTRTVPLASGTPLVAGRRQPGGRFVVSTASSLWRSERCFAEAEPFDPAFGESGGEDLELLSRLQALGRSIVWCAEAGVWETVQPHRTRFSFFIRREFAGSQVYTAVKIRHTPRRIFTLTALLLRAIGQVSLGATWTLLMALLLPLRGRRGRPQLAAATILTVRGIGKFLWWRPTYPYRRERRLVASRIR